MNSEPEEDFSPIELEQFRAVNALLVVLKGNGFSKAAAAHLAGHFAFVLGIWDGAYASDAADQAYKEKLSVDVQ